MTGLFLSKLKILTLRDWSIFPLLWLAHIVVSLFWFLSFLIILDVTLYSHIDMFVIMFCWLTSNNWDQDPALLIDAFKLYDASGDLMEPRYINVCLFVGIRLFSSFFCFDMLLWLFSTGVWSSLCFSLGFLSCCTQRWGLLWCHFSMGKWIHEHALIHAWEILLGW